MFFDIGNYHVNEKLPGLDKSIGLTLLEPHINYTKHVFELLSSNIPVKGIAHITITVLKKCLIVFYHFA